MVTVGIPLFYSNFTFKEYKQNSMLMQLGAVTQKRKTYMKKIKQQND